MLKAATQKAFLMKYGTAFICYDVMSGFRSHSEVVLPLAWAAAGLALSLNTWLRRFPAELMDPRGELSLPAVDILEVGPGNLWRQENQDIHKQICTIYEENGHASCQRRTHCHITQVLLECFFF